MMNWKSKFCNPKIGDKVKFIDYYAHNDWERHEGQVGTIIEETKLNNYRYRIKWYDGERSDVPKDNIIII